MKKVDDTKDYEGSPKADSCVDRIWWGNRCSWDGIVSSIQISPPLSNVIVKNECVSGVVDWSCDQHIVFIKAKIEVVGYLIKLYNK